jgi:hypothetical protein
MLLVVMLEKETRYILIKCVSSYNNITVFFFFFLLCLNFYQNLNNLVIYLFFWSQL